ncbi:MAG: two-component system, cell cycle sensor histidine kinase and response regulator CckA, partial [Thermoanaerobaculia bacterium]|nr:two-component system, cell cycle sensor histidine kinase and response regulator CckA [Thermoanaerobaculia bacterium]
MIESHTFGFKEYCITSGGFMHSLMKELSERQDQRRSRLLDAMPAIAWSASAETFRFNYVNPAAEKLLGYPVSRWIEESHFWAEHLHPDDWHVPMLCHNETVAGRNHELVYRFIAADGRTVWLRDYVNVHKVEGEPVELFGVMVDITREREAEAAASVERENFRRMVELSPDCIGVHVDDTYVYVNQAFVQLLGATSEAEIIGRDVFSFVDASSHGSTRARLERLRAGESVPYIRQTYRRADGSPLDVEVAALPLRYGDGDAVQIIARDITEKVRAQRALEESEQRYRELVEDVTEILFTVDCAGRFVSLNRSFERSTGYPIEEWLGRPFGELFLPHSLSTAADDFAQALAGHERAIHAYDLLAQSGAVVTVEVSWQPRYVEGVLTGTIGMARDVTEQRNIARRLEDAKRMSSLGQVAASLAHEFNNVLMGIQPFVEVIGRSNPPESAISDALAHIRRAIGRGKRASQEILRFVNPKEPQLFVFDASVWLPSLLGQLVAALPPAIALSSSIDPAVKFIRGDREHLEQVITNLVFNARDAIEGTGTIRIGVALACSPGSSRAEAKFVHMSVSDDGPGIAPANMDRIFEPLFTTKRNGTGLGLAIARRLIEGHGGMLTAENRPEGGSAFHLLVPAADAPCASTRPVALPASGVRRVLLVEDDVSVGQGLKELLNAEGFEATWVKAAGDACEAARRTCPQVAIIDVNLPDGNGVDLLPLLRAEHADLPIIFSTGHVELSLSSKEHRIVALMKPY